MLYDSAPCVCRTRASSSSYAPPAPGSRTGGGVVRGRTGRLLGTPTRHRRRRRARPARRRRRVRGARPDRRKRMRRGLTTVTDSTGLVAGRRAAWRALAERNGVPAHAVLFDAPAKVVRERNRAREPPVPGKFVSAQLPAAADAGDAVALRRIRRRARARAGRAGPDRRAGRPISGTLTAVVVISGRERNTRAPRPRALGLFGRRAPADSPALLSRLLRSDSLRAAFADTPSPG